MAECEEGPSTSSPTVEVSSTPRLSQGYLYACQRAELLGLPTPTEAEFFASEDYARERDAVEQDGHDDAVAQELEENDECMQRIGGGLDELNTILNATQKKINKFKNVCGSLGTLLKARVSSSPGTPEHKPRAGSSSEQEEVPAAEGDAEEEPPQPQAAPRKADLNAKVGSHLDKLDSLINKAENAQYSMKHQTKQMKAYMK
ncbi:uncharacterized protein LOC106645408 [Copidosoma floridanum]|uniref:uncharacterized protein LOC106645408 n=1 Tax=Copidosoma floridanum TaxID=29053 RepID=UPI0006C9B2E9|nr:uncharacterized protein LOC106645408 [Copidosoma floridanum]